MTINSANSASLNYLLPDLEIRHVDGKGKGVFARKLIPAMTLVCVGLPIEISLSRTLHSFQTDWQRHVELDEPARLINHGCDFNLVIRNNESGGYSFVAARDIHPGEELCWHYGMTEAISIAVSQCRCGSALCRGRSVGFMELSKAEQSHLHKNGIAAYLSNWYVGQRRELEVVHT
jgi:hypothetical protein